MNKTDRAFQLIKDAQVAVVQELERCRRGVSTVGTFQQLLAIQKKLGEMELSIVRGIASTQYDRSMGRMIVDSWPLGSTLGELILSAEKAYLQL